MPSSPGFQFRQFYVRHDRSSMKVGTDGVLLGAWCNLPDSLHENGARILDIGTGCGLIALMLAQRTEGRCAIDAIDIDVASVEQAKENFSASPWSSMLHVQHCAVQEHQGTYELIVSNPPFFSHSLKCPNPQRSQARHADEGLSYEALMQHSARLLSARGQVTVIIPHSEVPTLLSAAHAVGLWEQACCHIHPLPGKEAIRAIVCLSKTQAEKMAEEQLCIQNTHSPRSEEYALLTKDFYL